MSGKHQPAAQSYTELHFPSRTMDVRWMTCFRSLTWRGVIFDITATQRTGWYSCSTRMSVPGPAQCTSGTSWNREWLSWSTTIQTTPRSVVTGTMLRSREKGRLVLWERSMLRFSLGKLFGTQMLLFCCDRIHPCQNRLQIIVLCTLF